MKNFRELFRITELKKFPKTGCNMGDIEIIKNLINEKEVSEYKKILVKYYENNNIKEISEFLKNRCWRKM